MIQLMQFRKFNVLRCPECGKIIEPEPRSITVDVRLMLRADPMLRDVVWSAVMSGKRCEQFVEPYDERS